MNKQQILKQKIQQSPNYFYENILGSKLWSKEKEITETIEKNNRIAIRSCHAVGKTYTIARVVLRFLFGFKNTIIITTAPTWKQVEGVLWKQIRSAYFGANGPVLLGGECLKFQLNISDDWYAFGLATDEPEKFQGYHGAKKIWIIVDEASGVPDSIYEAIDGVLSGGESGLIMIGNPTKLTGRFNRSFKEKSVAKIHISAFDTPNFIKNGILKLEDLTEEKTVNAKVFIPGLITPQWAMEMKERYGEDSDIFKVRVLGEFPSKDINTLVSIDEIEKCFYREVKQTGRVIIGGDVARFGDDFTSIIVRQGHKVIDKIKFSKMDLMSICGEFVKIFSKYDSYVANIDAIGIGAGVVDRLQEQGYNINGINVGNKPSDPMDPDDIVLYKNLRAELYDMIRQNIKYLSLPRDEDWYQLANIKYKYDSAGRLQIESKEEMKKRGLKSPDDIDALALTYASENVSEFNVKKDLI